MHLPSVRPARQQPTRRPRQARAISQSEITGGESSNPRMQGQDPVRSVSPPGWPAERNPAGGRPDEGGEEAAARPAPGAGRTGYSCLDRHESLTSPRRPRAAMARSGAVRRSGHRQSLVRKQRRYPGRRGRTPWRAATRAVAWVAGRCPHSGRSRAGSPEITHRLFLNCPPADPPVRPLPLTPPRRYAPTGQLCTGSLVCMYSM
jgi:hypothetical protein